MGVILDTSKSLIPMSDCSSVFFLILLSILFFFLIHYSPSDFYYICLSSSLHHLKCGLFFHTRLTSRCPFTLLPSQACHSPIYFTCSLELLNRDLTIFHNVQDPPKPSLCVSLCSHISTVCSSANPLHLY